MSESNEAIKVLDSKSEALFAQIRKDLKLSETVEIKYGRDDGGNCIEIRPTDGGEPLSHLPRSHQGKRLIIFCPRPIEEA